MKRASIVLVVFSLALAGMVLMRTEMSVDDAIKTAAPAAAPLGFDLLRTSQPASAGSDIWGTRSFHWRLAGEGGTLHVLSYLVVDERLCWSSVRGENTTDHGCVVAKAP